MKPKAQEELVYLDMTLKLPFKWRTGEPMGEFFRELKTNGKIYANQCPKCGRFYCPPINVCTRDHTRCTEKDKWVACGPKGTVLTRLCCGTIIPGSHYRRNAAGSVRSGHSFDGWRTHNTAAPDGRN